MGIKHPFTSSKSDGADSTKVRASSWNADHTIDGDVDFGGHAITNIEDEAYNATAWNGSLEAPTKNAVRDKIEALVLSGGGVTDFLALTDTPNAYTGFGGRLTSGALARVNTAANSLEFKYGVDGYRNVRDYGAVGDGVADDTVAIQAALDDYSGDYSTDQTGIVYFPVGSYLVTSSIDCQRGTHTHIGLKGENGAFISGSFAGPIFKRESLGGTTHTVFSVDGLRIECGGNAAAGCLEIADNVCSTITNCLFSTSVGSAATLVRVGVADSTSFYGCNFLGGGNTSTNYGIKGAGCQINSCSFQGNGVAVNCHGTPGPTLLNCRFEVNGTGCQSGGDFNTDPFFLGASSNDSCSSFVIIGGHGESNDIYFNATNGGNVTIIGVFIAAFIGSNTHAILITQSTNVLIADVFTGADNYSVAAIKLSRASFSTVQNVHVVNTLATATGWDIDANIDTTSWINTDFPGAWVSKYNERPTSIFTGVTTCAATIASGAITVTGNYMMVDTEAAAASDDLDTINGTAAIVNGNTGGRLILRAADSARTVVCKDGTGNLRLAGDFSLDNEQDTIELIWDGTLATWLEVGRSDNGA